VSARSGENNLGAVSVSELTYALKGHVESQFRGVRVEGEVLSARAVSSGHLYFTLKDQGAQLPCVVWRSTLVRMPLKIKDGMSVVAYGDVQVYPPHGRYQLVVRRVVDVGVGALLAQLEALKQHYNGLGLFAPERKRRLPLLPRRIGVVTAATGAAIRDIIATIQRRFPSDVLLYPVRVQGDGAAAEIAHAIAVLDAQPQVDVIIIGRGGGSLEDLWAFNEAVVIQAIVDAQTPIVSAVGHEIDTPLSDLAADFRATTPTAAGEVVVPSLADLRYTMDQHLQRLKRHANQRREVAMQQLIALVSRLPDPDRAVADRQQLLDDRRVRLAGAMTQTLTTRRGRLAQAMARLRNLHPRTTLSAERARLEALDVRLSRAVRSHVQTRRASVTSVRRALTILSPTASLERGYAIVRGPNKNVLRDATTVSAGDSLEVILHRGALDATVTARHGRHAFETTEES
jgi:exodeoxyribonuclease VII large subunit